MVAYLKASSTEKTYFDYLQAAREAEKEESTELSQNPWSQPINNTTKPKTTSFFPLWKLKGNQPVPKMATVHLAHLEEESTKRKEEEEIEDLGSIDGITEEFMVCLAWAMKDAQVEDKHCYHCSSPKHFICDFSLVRASRQNIQLNHKEGMALRKEAQTPLMKMTMHKNPRRRFPRHNMSQADSLLESRPFSALAWGQKHSYSKDQWGGLHGSHGQWCTNQHCHA